MIRRLAFLHWLRPGRRSPASPVLSRRYDALPPSRRASFPSHGGTSVALTNFAPWRVSAPPGPGVVARYLQPGICRGANRVLPSSWGTSIVRLHMFHSDAGRTACTRPYSTAAWPLVIERQRLPRKVFRRSIAWLSDWLSTLRDVSYPSTTQDSLPAAGQALPGGLSTRKVPMKGFRSASLHTILLSQALLGAIDATEGSSQSPRIGVSVPHVRAESTVVRRRYGRYVRLTGYGRTDTGHALIRRLEVGHQRA